MWTLSTSAVAIRKKGGSYHHGDLRGALLDATLALIAERSVGEVTLREVARRAGVTHNAPYRHFDDKSALLAAVAAEGFADLSRALREVREAIADAEERFVSTGLAYVRFAGERPSHVALMFGVDVAKSRTRELQDAANDTFQVLKDLAADAGIVEVEEARRLGTIAWSFLHGLVVLTSHQQVPRAVGATPENLAILGLRQMFASFRATAKRTRQSRV